MTSNPDAVRVMPPGQDALDATNSEIADQVLRAGIDGLERASNDLRTAVREQRMDEAIRLQNQVRTLMVSIRQSMPYDPDGLVTVDFRSRVRATPGTDEDGAYYRALAAPARNRRGVSPGHVSS